MFDFIASILTFFYAIWDSYGVMIILLTVSVRIVFTPLTVRGTKSMLAMRKVQPEMKKLQAKYRNDRAKLNQELSSLYRKHKINPLGGCLPLIAQAPVFLVLYQVLRGLSRRTSFLGRSIGGRAAQDVATGCDLAGPSSAGAIDCSEAAIASFPDATFNPRYLDRDSLLFNDLSGDTEMLWIGIDLALSPSAALSESLVKALPYFLMMIIVGVLGFLQQRQIAGRNPDAEVNPMQRTLMRVLPIFLPVISFTLPAGLVLYFITTSLIGVVQQDFITRRVYKPWSAEEEKRKEEEPEEEEESEQTEQQPQPRASLFGPKPVDDGRVHGRRRPSSVPPPKPKATPPKATSPKAIPPSAKNSSNKTNAAKNGTNKSGSQRKQVADKQSPAPEQRTSKRVTPPKNKKRR